MAEKKNDEGQEPTRVNTRKEFDARVEDVFGKDALRRWKERDMNDEGQESTRVNTRKEFDARVEGDGLGVVTIVGLLFWLLVLGLLIGAEIWLEMGDEVLDLSFDLIIAALIAFAGAGFVVVWVDEQRSKNELGEVGKVVARGMEVAAFVSLLLLGLFFGLTVVILCAALFTCGFFGLCGWAEGWLEMGDSFVGFFTTVIVVTAGLLGVGLGAERLLRSWRRPR